MPIALRGFEGLVGDSVGRIQNPAVQAVQPAEGQPLVNLKIEDEIPFLAFVCQAIPAAFLRIAAIISCAKSKDRGPLNST